jgi:serine/threonine-protein kinase RsbW
LLANRLRDEFAPDLGGGHPAADVLRLGGTRWSPTMSDEFLRAISTSEAHFQLTKTLGFRSYMVVPIADARETVGALTLVSCSRPLNRDDVTLAELLANHVGTIVAKAKHLDEASLTSRQLQAALLPEVPGFLPGVRLYASYSAASESLDVGGDFYDVVRTPGGPIWLVIGDIEGHDRRAAAQMGQLRSAIRTLILQGLAPEDVIDELRRIWLFLGLTKTATLFLGQLNSSTGQLATASAGHPPPLLVYGASADFLATAPSSLLGRNGLSAVRYDCCIPDGGLLLLYTDGALRERTHGVDDGMARLRTVALGAPSNPRSLCEQVISSVGAGDDDVALLAIMRRSDEPAD